MNSLSNNDELSPTVWLIEAPQCLRVRVMAVLGDVIWNRVLGWVLRAGPSPTKAPNASITAPTAITSRLANPRSTAEFPFPDSLDPP